MKNEPKQLLSKIQKGQLTIQTQMWLSRVKYGDFVAPGQCELGVVLGRVLPPLSDGENKSWKKINFCGDIKFCAICAIVTIFINMKWA